MKNASDFLPISLKKKYQANASLREILNQHIDIELQQHYQILTYREPILTIGIDNAIWKMRFHQRLLDLRPTLQKSGYCVKQILFKITPNNRNIENKLYPVQRYLGEAFSPEVRAFVQQAARNTDDKIMKELFTSLLKN